MAWQEWLLLAVSVALLIACAALTWWLLPIALTVGVYAGHVGARCDRGRRGLDVWRWGR